MYDVIVVGAGPAGCTAAKALAEKGCKVLLVEKFKMPRYKSCSGVLIKKSMELVKKYFGEAVPETAMCTRQITGAWYSRMTRGRNTASSRRG
jgi:flavin-dependent dehydrogenase